jgi:hypothetical protein
MTKQIVASPSFANAPKILIVYALQMEIQETWVLEDLCIYLMWNIVLRWWLVADTKILQIALDTRNQNPRKLKFHISVRNIEAHRLLDNGTKASDKYAASNFRFISYPICCLCPTEQALSLSWWWKQRKDLHVNPLKTKRRQLYLKTQSVPRSKHFSSRL